MAFDQGAPQFGVNDAKIATWNATDDYGSITDVMGVQMGQAMAQVVSAIANGDDKIVAAASRLIGAGVTLRFVGMNTTVLSVITGVAPDTISSVVNTQIVGGERLPYFGIIIKALSEEGGDTWVFIPKVKIMSDFIIFQGEYGTFSTPEVTLQGVEDETWGIINFLTHPTDVAITVMPPADIAEVS